MFKFKKKLLFRIEESEAIDFCRILGKYGLEFKVSQVRSVPRDDESNKRTYYRVFAVYVTEHQSRALERELNADDESVFESY